MLNNTQEKKFLELRRQYILSDFSHLNPVQQQAVTTTEGPLLLLAGAGSGKTTVLINRIAKLLRYGSGGDETCDAVPEYITEDDLHFLEEAISGKNGNPERAQRICAVNPPNPWQIMAITFTNKAAGELKDRLSNMLGPAGEDVWAMTFHSACVRILRKDIEKLGFAPGFTIYDTSDSQSVMKQILKDMGLDEKQFPHRAVLSQIGKAKDAYIAPDDFLARMKSSGDLRKIKVAEAYVQYARRLKDANAMDFDDLIFFAVKLLLEHEDVREYYQKRFRYILVDEYQDTNHLQYILTSTLAGGYKNLCVVGDDDQSIYKFRGATIENILNFEQQYKNASTIRLEQNYRSTRNILSAANYVIKNNQGRKGKNLWTEHDAGDQIELYNAYNESAEAQYVASKIVDHYGKGGKWRDNAVLYRMNAQSNQLEFAFKRAGIPYRVVGGMRFFDRAEIKDILSYMCLIASITDDVRLRRIINVPARGIGATTVERIAAIAYDEGISMYDTLKKATYYPELKSAWTKLFKFSEMIDELTEASKSMPIDELFDLLIEKTGYVTALQAKNTDENRSRIENVWELKTNILNYIENTGDSSLLGFLDEVALYTDLDQQDKDADCAIMMTMHSAKGLEFPNVFIVGAEEGIFPGMRSIGDQEEMEEERRLCYVAITRAEERLCITHTRARTLFGKTSANQLSRFVREIPSDYIDLPAPAVSPESASGFGTRKTYAPKPKERPITPIDSVPRPKSAPPAFMTGDKVKHKAFGFGSVSKMTPVGGDYLIEIEFENIGLKRLMLKAAVQHMEKVDAGYDR